MAVRCTVVINIEDVFLNGKSVKFDGYSMNISEDTFLRNDMKDCKVNVCGSVKRVIDEVYLELNILLEFNCLCDKCLEPTDKIFNYSFKHLIVQTDVQNQNIDCISVSNYELSLDPIIIEDIILEFPRKIVCRDDCLGLCQKCGKNLNHGGCICTIKNVDPRLQALGDLLN